MTVPDWLAAAGWAVVRGAVILLCLSGGLVLLGAVAVLAGKVWRALVRDVAGAVVAAMRQDEARYACRSVAACDGDGADDTVGFDAGSDFTPYTPPAEDWRPSRTRRARRWGP